MTKTKVSIKTIVRYFRDFSIVVAGIAVTLYVNDRITNQGEKRDIKLYLDAIKLELEENIKDIDENLEYLQKSVRYANYLKSNDKKSLNKDTIVSYADSYYTFTTTFFKTNAFEMFKSSGAMRLMDNKELLLSIWTAYTELSNLKLILDQMYQMKLTEIDKDHQLPVEKRLPDFIPMYRFYMAPMPYEMVRLSEDASKILKETVEDLRKRNNH